MSHSENPRSTISFQDQPINKKYEPPKKHKLSIILRNAFKFSKDLLYLIILSYSQLCPFNLATFPFKVMYKLTLFFILKMKHLSNTSFEFSKTWNNNKLEDFLKFSQGPGITDKKKKPIGLRNRKETCYMNSMMQGLASSDKLIKLMESFSLDKRLELFLEILKDINDASNETVDIDSVTEKLVKFTGTVKWNRLSQQDAFQLMSFFVNAIEKEVEDQKTLIPPKFRLLHTFSESNQYNKVQDHLALSVPLCGDFKDSPGVKLTSLLDAFFRPSEIDDGDNTTTMYLFEVAPEVMILHIQANEWSFDLGEYIKPKYHIIYEDKFEYTFKIQRERDGSCCGEVKVGYKLTAVVHHMGQVSGGHYYTYRLHGGRWYLVNDEQVEEVTPFMYDIVPYVMVYEKID